MSTDVGTAKYSRDLWNNSKHCVLAIPLGSGAFAWGSRLWWDL